MRNIFIATVAFFTFHFSLFTVASAAITPTARSGATRLTGGTTLSRPAGTPAAGTTTPSSSGGVSLSRPGRTNPGARLSIGSYLGGRARDQGGSVAINNGGGGGGGTGPIEQGGNDERIDALEEDVAKIKNDMPDMSGYYTAPETDDLLLDKQDKLTAGDGVTISPEGIISVTGVGTGEPGEPGADGREVLMQTDGVYIQWKYSGEDTWHDLVSLSSLIGPQGLQGEPGAPGADGLDGRDPIIDRDGDSIRVGFSLEGPWTEILNINELNGSAGPVGPQGPAGEDGLPGLSAFEIAGLNGFTGSVTDWLSSLRGADGLPGPAGEPGADGAPGANGLPGASAYEIAVTLGFEGTPEQWLAALKGADGINGVDGKDGLTEEEIRTIIDGALAGKADATDITNINNAITNINGTLDDLGSAAFTDSTDYATAAQGALADTAVQPEDLSSIVLEETDPTVAPELSDLDRGDGGYALVYERKNGVLTKRWEKIVD